MTVIRIFKRYFVLVRVNSLKQELLYLFCIVLNICLSRSLVSAYVHVVQQGMSHLNLIFFEVLTFNQLFH